MSDNDEIQKWTEAERKEKKKVYLNVSKVFSFSMNLYSKDYFHIHLNSITPWLLSSLLLFYSLRVFHISIADGLSWEFEW